MVANVFNYAVLTSKEIATINLYSAPVVIILRPIACSHILGARAMIANGNIGGHGY